MRATHAQFRWTELVIAVAVVVAGLVWAERTAWNQITSLRSSITIERMDSFRSADRMRAAILGLRSELAAPKATGDHPEIISSASNRLSDALTNYLAQANSEEERALGVELSAAFSAAMRLTTNDSDHSGARKVLDEMLVRADRVAALNASSGERFIAEANGALNQLQRFLFVSLISLLAAGAVIVVLAYQRTIAPMRQTLSESRAIIERQEKLASLGVFAAGIAHEIRNPLTAIKVRLFSLKASHPPGTSERDDTEVIESEIARLERIVREFLQFARPAEPVLEPISSRKLLEEISRLLAADFAKKEIRLQLDIAADEPIRVDLDKMKQVLINLLQNAADSMPRGTVILRARKTRELLAGNTRDAVALEVIDAGQGMPPEVQRRLFDPFFTTKEEGTGLGLPISARIVEKHGGIIQYVTEPGKGTTFTVVLPKAREDEKQS